MKREFREKGHPVTKQEENRKETMESVKHSSRSPNGIRMYTLREGKSQRAEFVFELKPSDHYQYQFLQCVHVIMILLS